MNSEYVTLFFNRPKYVLACRNSSDESKMTMLSGGDSAADVILSYIRSLDSLEQLKLVTNIKIEFNITAIAMKEDLSHKPIVTESNKVTESVISPKEEPRIKRKYTRRQPIDGLPPQRIDAKGREVVPGTETPDQRVKRRGRVKGSKNKPKQLAKDDHMVPTESKPFHKNTLKNKDVELKNPGFAPISLSKVRDALERIGEPATLAMIAHDLGKHDTVNDHQTLNSILVQGKAIDWFEESRQGDWTIKSA